MKKESKGRDVVSLIFVIFTGFIILLVLLHGVNFPTQSLTGYFSETESYNSSDTSTDSVSFSFFSDKDSYLLGENILFLITPASAEYDINILMPDNKIIHIDALQYIPTMQGAYIINVLLTSDNISKRFTKSIIVHESSI